MNPEDLVTAVDNSNTARIEAMKEEIKGYADPWQLHLSLFPAVQRALNPPFINPHLPKMYNICRELVPYLSKEDVPSLVYLELLEYARRAKLEKILVDEPPRAKLDFGDVEKAIAARDREKAFLLLCAFFEQRGLNELLRRLLLLGSGYLRESLGHSISCTAFILRELMERPAIDARPALFLLTDYFCKGGFHTTPRLSIPGSALSTDDLSRSVTGRGFVDLHHTITLYAIERTKPFFSSEEHGHMIAAWLDFMGNKEAEPRSFASTGTIREYHNFFETFSRLDPDAVLDLVGGMVASPADRSRLCSFLVTAVCDLYQGDYNPHYLTGLGSLLWVVNTYPDNVALVQNALYQYLGFYFSGLKSED